MFSRYCNEWRKKIGTRPTGIYGDDKDQPLYLGDAHRISDLDDPSDICCRHSYTLWIVNIFATNLYTTILGALSGFFGALIQSQSHANIINAAKAGAVGGAILGVPVGMVYGPCNFDFFEKVASEKSFERFLNCCTKSAMIFTFAFSMLLGFFSGLLGHSVLESQGFDTGMDFNATTACFGSGSVPATVGLTVFIVACTYIGRSLTIEPEDSNGLTSTLTA